MKSKLWITFCLTWLVLRVASGINFKSSEQKVSDHTQKEYSLPLVERS